MCMLREKTINICFLTLYYVIHRLIIIPFPQEVCAKTDFHEPKLRWVEEAICMGTVSWEGSQMHTWKE
jgi:hypothetical protein